jgi:hypothetical protein
MARQRAIAGKSSSPPIGQQPSVAGMHEVSPAVDGDEDAFDFGKPVE